MKRCFAYTRVSTLSQEDGASLSEQKSVIAQYAEKHGLYVIEWFEEVETAAKPGRPIFGRVVKLLRKKKAEGLIMHKIDRSSRNFHDWAEVNDLADNGIAVHFASENLELDSRGRRLLADIQVVFATDYIRNLKEEIRKGIDGRLREGLMPWGAPLGYVNNGSGKKKTVCRVNGPLVREAFELYATGRYTLKTLSRELRARGLKNQCGGPLTLGSLSRILTNPFYIGLIRHRNTVYSGAHEPLISKALFDEVGRRLQAKVGQKVKKHVFTYRRTFRCAECKHFLIPERQKGLVYCRCHTTSCSRPCVREETIEHAIMAAFDQLATADIVRERMEAYAGELLGEHEKRENEAREGWKCQLGAIEARENRLVDAYLEGAIDKETLEKRRNALILEKKGIEEKLCQEKNSEEIRDRIGKILELAFTASLSHRMATDEEKRQLLEMLTSNLYIDGKNVVVELSFPFSLLAFGEKMQSGGRDRISSRSRTNLLRPASSLDQTLRHVAEKLCDWVIQHPEDPLWLSRRG